MLLNFQVANWACFRDPINFTMEAGPERDAGGHLVKIGAKSRPLADFASFEGLRKGTKIRDIYLDGRLGGIPRHIGELGAVIKEVAYANA